MTSPALMPRERARRSSASRSWGLRRTDSRVVRWPFLITAAGMTSADMVPVLHRLSSPYQPGEDNIGGIISTPREPATLATVTLPDVKTVDGDTSPINTGNDDTS